MKRAFYLDSARDDRRDILSYIVRKSQSVRSGQLFMQKLNAHCDHLASLPFEMGKLRAELGNGLRSSVFGNDVIFFRYNEDRMEVVNTLEGHVDIESRFHEPDPE